MRRATWRIALGTNIEEDADEAKILAALGRVLSQPDFSASPRLSSFLQFVVAETLEGRADRLKAFTIASMALGHDEKFNPKTNSIVRVQAGRLRRLLVNYYEGPGRFDTWEIRLRPGSYVPEFLSRGPHEPESATLQIDTEPSESPKPRGDPTIPDQKMRRAQKGFGFSLALAIIVMALGLGTGAIIWRAVTSTARAPVASSWADASATISVDPIETTGDDPAAQVFVDDVEARLENAISRFDDPVVLHRGADAQLASQPDYRLSGRLTPSGDGTMSLAFRIWHPASGEIVWTRTFDGLHLDRAEAALEPTVSAVSTAVAQTYGVVFTDMHKRLSGRSDGFGCLVLAYNYFKAPSSPAHQAARDCLERSVAQHPDFAPGFAALAYLMVDTYLTGLDARPDEKPLDVAIEMANRAIDLAPQKARMHAAIFQTRFFNKRFEDAFESADWALQLNPYATDTPARIGAAYVLRGDFDKGIALIQRALRFNASPPGWYEFYLFLDAHMRGDQHGAERHALRRSAMRFPLGLVARIIVAHEQGDADAVTQWKQRLREAYPAFAADIPAAFDRYAMAPNIRTKLIADLAEAGVPTKGQ